MTFAPPEIAERLRRKAEEARARLEAAAPVSPSAAEGLALGRVGAPRLVAAPRRRRGAPVVEHWQEAAESRGRGT